MRRNRIFSIAAIFTILGIGGTGIQSAEVLKLERNAHLVLVGNGLGSRMMQYGHFETEVQQRFPGHHLFIRNMCDEGNTPGFRPHSGRPSPWAFPGADQFRKKLSDAKDRWGSGHTGHGEFETPDQWLTRLEADMIVAFFGFNESFEGVEGLANFKAELTAFVEHTQTQRYNGRSPARLALVSPIAFEDLSRIQDTPDGKVENANLALYTAAMGDVAVKYDLLFVNLFTITQAWFDTTEKPLTRDGTLLTEAGYARIAPILADALFGQTEKPGGEHSRILKTVREKNWFWHKLYKIPNGVHVYGRRHRPFGPENYPHELKKLEEMTAIRDQAIWATLEGRPFDIDRADQTTHTIPEIKTNYNPKGRKTGSMDYRHGQDALNSFTVAEGYRIELFASEQEFRNLANPVQLSFDNRGRLWVATMPTYPHYRPGDAKPQDKLIILEDTDGNGKADRETVFADNLHLPTGFEFAPEGVYVAQGTHLVLLRDRDGDDRVDATEIILSGFDDHDTHHVISAFCADPSGAIFMGEGTFLHSNVETAYGPIRSSNGGFFRYNSQRRHLQRIARLSIPNPWGTAFDEWGQNFFTDTSDPNVRWMLPGSVHVDYGEFTPNPPNLIENKHRVRPTSGLEFVSSRHFPDETQGDLLINNTIGFLGTKQHTFKDKGVGYISAHRQDLVRSSDPNFRPVDMEFAPDGSLYLVDWHNMLVGHMQHSARDPLRDHEHGRIYRITYPSRPLVEAAPVYGASIRQLLDNLKLPEYRTRYRTRRELRGRDPEAVRVALIEWITELDPNNLAYEHRLVEALWVGWGLNRVDGELLVRLLDAGDFRARAAAVRVLGHSGHQVENQRLLLKKMAGDPHGRVRMEAIVAASYLAPSEGMPILEVAAGKPIDEWIEPVNATALAHLSGQPIVSESTEPAIETDLKGEEKRLFIKGAEVYRREGHCATCHQPDGLGLSAAHFPPLAGTKWIQGDEERLIKLTLNGLLGSIEVKGVHYSGLVPMTPFKWLSDEEIASVLTYVRNSFGNAASVIMPEQVKAVRKQTQRKTGFYSPADLLSKHPHR